jgi:hypothetical protein
VFSMKKSQLRPFFIRLLLILWKKCSISPIWKVVVVIVVK